MKTPFYILLAVFGLIITKSSLGQVGTITSSQSNPVCRGASGFLTVHGYIAPIDHWEVSTTGGATWNSISNSAGDTSRSFFQISNNVCYRVIHDGGNSISAVYCIAVDDTSNAGSIVGGGQQCGVANGTMTVSGNNGTILGWYLSTGGPFSSLSNTTTSQVFNVTQTTQYAFVTKNGVCPADTTYSTISIVPYSNAGIAAASGSTTVCASGNTGSINVSSTVGSIVYWQSSTNGTTWTNISNATSNLTYTNLTQTTLYHVVVKSGICPDATSNNVTIQVDPVSVGGMLNGGTYLCGTGPANGTLTLSGQTGAIGNWEYSANNGSSWTAGSCTGTTTCPYNVSSGSILYRVNVKSGVCPQVYSVLDTVTVSPVSVAGTLTSSTDSLCAFSGQGTLSITGSVGTNYNWQFSSNGGTTWNNMPSFSGTTANYSNLPTGTYYFHCNVKSNNCPVSTTNNVSVYVSPKPTINIITNDTTIEIGNSIVIESNGTGNPSWLPSESLSSATSYTTTGTPLASITYTLTVTDASGCIASDTIHITVTGEGFKGFVSNALTPNGDNINDELYVENIETIPENDIKIFNEYGQEVYSASPYKNDWKGTYNGSRLPDGTYYYVLTVKSTQKEYKGFITLMSGK